MLQKTRQLCLAREHWQVLDDKNLLAVFGKHQRFLQCRISSADHGYRLAGIKCAVAHGTEGNAVADEFLLAVNPEQAVMRSRRKNYRARKIFTVFREYAEAVIFTTDGGCLPECDFSTVGKHLIQHFFRQFIP